MFSVNVRDKQVIIDHTVQAADGKVDLEIKFDLHDVPAERILLWAATHRLTEWLQTLDICRLKSAEVKKQFDNLVIDCKEPSESRDKTERREEEIIDNLRTLVREGASIERVVQTVIRSTRNRN